MYQVVAIIWYKGLRTVCQFHLAYIFDALAFLHGRGHKAVQSGLERDAERAERDVVRGERGYRFTVE